ncbi:protein ELYS homolog isoform X2 [Lutzomyia longipalpis]|uniref:protein ELYS homolog isoform X2 n=1 Tax=Lutzomyia longipalpis TaxID=7200 RepID=UPI00248443E7|nr:protein ELYS homolog isoform X2 [Lutzomyia longipalpis]
MELTLKSSVSFVNRLQEEQSSESNEQDNLTGICRNGRLCWKAQGPILEVTAVGTGAKVSGYNFQHTLRSLTLSITCVAEVDVPEIQTAVLAVGFETSAFDGVICLYSVQGSRPLQFISINDGIASCTQVQVGYFSNILGAYDGCLAVGTSSGKLALVNLNFLGFRTSMFALNQHILSHVEPLPCTIMDAEAPLESMQRALNHAMRGKTFFGVEISVDDSSAIISLLDLPDVAMLATGCADGSLVLYNLQKLEGIHKAYPPKSNCPLMKLAFMEPADDPRGHVYIWALHSWSKLPIAVMHSVTIGEDVDERNSTVLKYFKSSRPCLTMPNYSENLHPLDCQTFSRQLTPEDPITSICMLSWGSVDGGGQILVFDLNQWYKEQLPDYAEWHEGSTFLAIFPVTTGQLCNVWLDESTVTAFNSIQRPEEHFYPNSLTFDCICVTETGCDRYHWPGLQNRALENFMAYGPKAILDPDQCYREMLAAVLLPQFTEFNHKENSSITAKRDLLLSIALEYNCVGILRECAKIWADGSHLGRQPFEGLSLSTLTEWIWQRVGAVQECCEKLCECLFDLSGRSLDAHGTKTLAHCTRQLRLLAELLEIIVTFCAEYIPQDVQETLSEQLRSMQKSADYHEVLQWLFNMGLLPEGQWNSSPKSLTLSSYSQETIDAIPYPYTILKDFYDKQRMGFHSFTRKGSFHTGDCSCSLLYIDTFIERECSGAMLRNLWRKSGGNGLYPPTSLQSMIKIFRLTDFPVENKYALCMYLLLDLDMTMKNEEKYAGIIRNLIKFPAVFKMNTSLIKTTQAFWKLDHGDLEGALEDLVSPLGQDKHLSQWQMELLIECLLAQDNLGLALRALQAPGPPISPLLEMRTLLSNKLVCEAFQLQKSRGDPTLLRHFFTMCWEMKLMGKILNLALTEADGEVLGEFLREVDCNLASNLQFTYLLQRSKYMEALKLVAELQRKQMCQGNVDTETVGLVMDAYNSTMTPSVRDLSQMFFQQHRKFPPHSKDPVPLSSNLIKQKRSLSGGIYQKSAAAVENATLSWLFQAKSTNQLTSAPFVRKPIQEFLLRPESKMVYARAIDSTQKRKIEKESPAKEEEFGGVKKKYRFDDPTRHLTPFPQKTRAHQFDSDLHQQVSKLQETIKTQNSTIFSQTSLKFFDVDSPAQTQTNFMVQDIQGEPQDEPMDESDMDRSPMKGTSFLGATPRPSLRETSPVSKERSQQDSSIDEYFSPASSRNNSKLFDSPKGRRSLRDLSPSPHKIQEEVKSSVELLVSSAEATEEKLLPPSEPVLCELPEDTSQKENNAEETPNEAQTTSFEIVEVSESAYLPAKHSLPDMSIPAIVVTCEDDQEEADVLASDTSKDSLKIVEEEVSECSEVDVEEQDKEVEREEDDQDEEEQESEDEEEVQRPAKRMLLNPAVLAQKMKSREASVSSSEEVEDENIEVEGDEEEEDGDEEEVEEEEDDEEEESGSEESDEEAERAGRTYKFFHENDDKLEKEEEDDEDDEEEEAEDDGAEDEEIEIEEDEEERINESRIPPRKPIVSNEVIDILDSSDDEVPTPQEVKPVAAVLPSLMRKKSVMLDIGIDVSPLKNSPLRQPGPSKVTSDDLYGNLEIQEDSQYGNDELNDALMFEQSSATQGEPDEAMEVTEMEESEHNKGALMTTVFSHEAATFEVRELDEPMEEDEQESVEIHNKAALMTTVFSHEIEHTDEPSAVDVLNTGAIISTVYPGEEVPANIFHSDPPSMAEESSLNVMEKGIIYDEGDDAEISFKSCDESFSKSNEKIDLQTENDVKEPSADQQVTEVIKAQEEIQENFQESREQDEKEPKLSEAQQIPDAKIEESSEVDHVAAMPQKSTEESLTTDAAPSNNPPALESEKISSSSAEQEPPKELIESTTEADSHENESQEERQEVVEIIPPPKFAYLTTDTHPDKEEAQEVPTEEKPGENVLKENENKSKEIEEKTSHQIEESTEVRKNKSKSAKGIKRSASTEDQQSAGVPKRITRATSVPKMSTIEEENLMEMEEKTPAKKRRNSRAASEAKDTPRPMGMLTRRKSMLLENSENEGTPTPKARITQRRSSVLVEEREATPRSTRARSKPLEILPETKNTPRKRRAQSEDPQEGKDAAQASRQTRSRSTTPLPMSPVPEEDTPKTKKRPRSRLASTSSVDVADGDTPSKNLRSRKRSVDESSVDDAKSERSFVGRKSRNIRGASKPPVEPDIQEEETEEASLAYSETRRLTRSQLAVLEKVSKGTKATEPKAPKRAKRASRADESSDHESVMSEKSTPESIKSKGSRTSKSTRGKRGMSVESTSSAGSKTRGRRGKATATTDTSPAKEDNAPGRNLRKKK